MHCANIRVMARRSTLASLQSRLRFARSGLLWLALLLALAQTVAIRHGYSHSVAESASTAAGKHSGGLAHCQSCIAAAAIGGAAPPPPALLLAQPITQAPLVSVASVQHAPSPYRPYAIRAPPALSC
jgi:hypothetical protein